MKIEAIKMDIQRVKMKISLLQVWMCEHPQHPDREKILGDINYWKVKLKTREYNLSQVMAGQPSHGEELPPEVDANASLHGGPNK